MPKIKTRGRPKTRIQAKAKQKRLVSSASKDLSQKKVLTISEAAKLNKVSRQAIYVAIKLNKLKAKKDTSQWTIDRDDLISYRKDKYSRRKSVFGGELIFDRSKGLYSVNEVARMLRVPVQKIYYATRIGRLNAHRKGAAWVISMNDLKRFCNEYLPKKTIKLEAV